MPLAFWVCSSVTAITAIVSFGYFSTELRNAESSSSSKTAALYAFSRSLAFLIVAVVAPFTGSLAFVAAIAIAMIIVQAADAVIGAVNQDRFKTYGPAATAVAILGALLWMLLAQDPGSATLTAFGKHDGHPRV